MLVLKTKTQIMALVNERHKKCLLVHYYSLILIRPY